MLYVVHDSSFSVCSVLANRFGSDLLRGNKEKGREEIKKKVYRRVKTHIVQWIQFIPHFIDWCSTCGIGMRRVNNIHEKLPNFLEKMKKKFRIITSEEKKSVIKINVLYQITGEHLLPLVLPKFWNQWDSLSIMICLWTYIWCSNYCKVSKNKVIQLQFNNLIEGDTRMSCRRKI